MRGGVGRAFRAAADILLPRRCIVCGCKLLTDEKHLCLHCLADIPQTDFWTHKFNPMAERLNPLVSKNENTPYINAAALFFYDNEGNYKKIPYQIKYHGNLQAGRYFGNMLGRKIALAPWAEDIDAVIPVPLHWRRKFSRGYNQAEILAKEVAKTIGAPLRRDILKRVRYTTTQTKLEVVEKSQNVTNAFSVSKRIMELAAEDPTNLTSVRHLLLVDDVFTTGNTLASCIRALQQVLPEDVRISVATLAFVGRA